MSEASKTPEGQAARDTSGQVADAVRGNWVDRLAPQLKPLLASAGDFGEWPESMLQFRAQKQADGVPAKGRGPFPQKREARWQRGAGWKTRAWKNARVDIPLYQRVRDGFKPPLEQQIRT